MTYYKKGDFVTLPSGKKAEIVEVLWQDNKPQALKVTSDDPLYPSPKVVLVRDLSVSEVKQ